MRVGVLFGRHCGAPLLAAALGIAGPEAALAQSAYPMRPIRMIVPYPPGGATDLMGRTAAERIAEALGQQVVVDNRGGGATIIGSELGARSPADGYTVVVGTITSLVLIPLLHRKLAYDPARDFEPVSMLASQPYVLTVHPSVPANSVAQFIAFAKKADGKLAMSSAGQGGGAHIAGEMFQQMAGVRLLHVPYKGTGPSLIDLVGGHVSVTFAGVTSTKPLAAAGKVRTIAVTTSRRSAAVPDLPTIAESGVPGYETNTWNALLVPRGTPKNIVERLNAAIVTGFNRPEVRDKLREQGADPEAGTPQQLADYIRRETERLARVVKLAGLKPQ